MYLSIYLSIYIYINDYTRMNHDLLCNIAVTSAPLPPPVASLLPPPARSGRPPSIQRPACHLR